VGVKSVFLADFRLMFRTFEAGSCGDLKGWLEVQRVGWGLKGLVGGSNVQRVGWRVTVRGGGFYTCES
jgi:hypothetical protein